MPLSAAFKKCRVLRVIVLLLSLAARGIKPSAVAFWCTLRGAHQDSGHLNLNARGIHYDSKDSVLICSAGTPEAKAVSRVMSMIAVGPQDMNVQLVKSPSVARLIISGVTRPCQYPAGAAGSLERVMITRHPTVSARVLRSSFNMRYSRLR